MNNKVVVNVGLAINGSEHDVAYRVARAISAIASRFGGICHVEIGVSDTETTLICVCDGVSLDVLSHNWRWWEISAELEQDCVAIWDCAEQYGDLIGPKASSWGEFNLEFFLFPKLWRYQGSYTTRNGGKV